MNLFLFGSSNEVRRLTEYSKNLTWVDTNYNLIRLMKIFKIDVCTEPYISLAGPIHYIIIFKDVLIKHIKHKTRKCNRYGLKLYKT